MALPLRTTAPVALALLAFAANSLLTRLGLGAGEIAATTFTALRLFGGAVALALLARGTAGNWRWLQPRGCGGPLALCLYALPFSCSYLRIGAATGALVLFGSVQLTMLTFAVLRGERPRPAAWFGFAIAAGGLAWLVAPSAARPDPLGVAEMALAGIAWAVYTILGRGAGEPIAANARAFLFATPLALLACLGETTPVPTSARGIALALVSGAVTSGLGYAVWYHALPGLTVAQAAFAQLAVPVLAALGAVAWLGEAVTLRLVVASVLVLGGTGLALAARAPGRR